MGDPYQQIWVSAVGDSLIPSRFGDEGEGKNRAACVCGAEKGPSRAQLTEAQLGLTRWTFFFEECVGHLFLASKMPIVTTEVKNLRQHIIYLIYG